jgi:hypothetical protein
MSEAATALRETVTTALPRLRALSEAETARRSAPGKWSAREIIGHLIDSAAVNHARFVRGQFKEDLVFPGYDQDAWVRAQHYQSAPWNELVDLWSLYNLHLARVMEAAPETLVSREHSRHNFHEIAWRTVTPEALVTLGDLMLDYVFHLRHHLDQIPGPDASS